MLKEYTKKCSILINFTTEDITELKQFYNTTPISFELFLSIIIK